MAFISNKLCFRTSKGGLRSDSQLHLDVSKCSFQQNFYGNRPFSVTVEDALLEVILSVNSSEI